MIWPNHYKNTVCRLPLLHYYSSAFLSLWNLLQTMRQSQEHVTPGAFHQDGEQSAARTLKVQ